MNGAGPVGGPLAGRVVVIAGGAGDIGFGTATALLAHGAVVVLVDRDPDALDRRTDAVGPDHALHRRVVDVADPEQCDRTVAEVSETFGTVDALVNAAMVTRRGTIDRIDAVAWQQLIAVNLSAVFFMCRSVIPVMRRSGGGVIVNMGSMAALRAMRSSPAYAAAKGGVVALSRALAIDHAAEGIRVFSVNPPAVDTSLFARTFLDEDDPDAARAEYVARQPGGRIVRIDEVAATVVHLIEGHGPPWTEEPLVV